jgi:hypothetical protein
MAIDGTQHRRAVLPTLTMDDTDIEAFARHFNAPVGWADRVCAGGRDTW